MAATETESPQLAEVDNAATSSKRKADVEEIEVDVNAPEPPSKRARRALKKGKSLPTKPSSDDEKEDKDEQKDGKDKVRSEHGVWIGNLPFRLTGAELRAWLIDNAGGVITEESITRVKLPTVKDANRRKDEKPANKGFAYVDFVDIGAKVAAIALSETELTGRKLLIKDAKSFEGRPAKEKEPEATAGKAEGKSDAKADQRLEANTSRKVFVGNLSFKTTEDDLIRNFEKCGEIEWAKLATFEDSGKCKGYGWVKFKEPEAAAWAVKGFVKIKEQVETEDDFRDDKSDNEAEDEEKEKEKSNQKQFKTRKWWVNRMLGRELKLELAEDDRVRYKKRFGKDAPKRADDTSRPPRRSRPDERDDSRGVKSSEPAPFKAAEDIAVARLTGGLVQHTGTKVTLDQALSQFRSSPLSSTITYTLHFEPYQLSPSFPPGSIDKKQWYFEHKHKGSVDAEDAFQSQLRRRAEPVGIELRFDGVMGNTLHAHRVIQYFQQSKGPETVNKLIDALYVRYFEQGLHPSEDDVLVESCVEAGIPEDEAMEVVLDKELGLGEVQTRLNEIKRDVDAVPVITFEGKKRDITLIGSKEVEEYLKVLDRIAREST
ncbi:hypothetical protein M441DRAFT_29321 [Trichoderma asperellum CBS 433.97]|uniref:RRM domain-containing protein n=1 Tax=Trichoderma asperellum (strain ATCC 204424 / CBS 433.97 / NBRC 101777) TaxID=1042311 RepID=A0A2T3Z2I4_TRIA4|nr:hypothetical protein M441DRAFT_29321 [Trichoderma asperellum CBS 433.97]PTB39026.1 hypothetical protein M441DRAFT_29321 [Trichoderma asperellum CBS 433.97]